MRHVDPARRLVEVARLLHNRWRKLAPNDRERLDELAGTVKTRALDLRGSADPDGAGRDLERSNRELADAIVDCAEADPDVDEIEVRRLRSDLAHELDRLASGEVRARAGTADDEPVDEETAGTEGRTSRAPWL
jgi:hypothetical protein